MPKTAIAPRAALMAAALPGVVLQGASADQIPLARALEGAGVRLWLASEAPQLDHRVIRFDSPARWERTGTRTASRTYGVTSLDSDEVPAAWLARIGCVDEIWVPSSAAVAALRAVTTTPTFRIPTGIDASAWPYRRRERGAKLRVLHMADVTSSYQDGADLAIAAFRAAFPAGRLDIELVLQGARPGHAIQTGDDRIVRAVGRRYESELVTFLEGFDAALYTTRADPDGRRLLEIAATGLPVIFAPYHGLADMADLGMTVSGRRVPASSGPGPARATATTPFGWWFEASHDALVSRLREVDQRYESVQDEAALAAEIVATEWTHGAAAAAIVERLRA